MRVDEELRRSGNLETWDIWALVLVNMTVIGFLFILGSECCFEDDE